MKQIMISLSLVCAMTKAQITITKDASFGSNGTVTILGVNSANNSLLLIPNIHSTFQGNKIFVSYSSDTGSSTQYTRLNSNGSLDTSFGNNGNILIPGLESYYFYANNNFFYTNGNEKYLSSGQLDNSFANSVMQNTNWNYKLVLSDDKILFRDDDALYKFLPSGNPDLSYGNNGSVNLNPSIAGDPNGNSSYEFFFSKDNMVYEFIDPSPGQSNVRKININTGNLDTSYGQNGYAQVKNAGIPVSAVHDSSVLFSASDASFINKFIGTNSIYFTETNGFGNLDLSIGSGGVITAGKIYNYNGTSYSAENTETLVYGDFIFVPAESASGELGIACYSLSGSSTAINNNTFHPLSGTSSVSSRILFIKDNYIYVIHDNHISRFIIQQQSLSVMSASKEKDIAFNNPFKDHLSVSSAEQIKEIEIFDKSGKLVLRAKDAKLNTESLVNDVYLVKISLISGKVISRKGIKY